MTPLTGPRFLVLPEKPDYDFLALGVPGERDSYREPGVAFTASTDMLLQPVPAALPSGPFEVV